MKRPVLIHGVLLSAALSAAYFTWTRDRTSVEDEVSVISLRGNLDRVIYKDEDRTVEIERRKDEHGSYHWVHVETMEAPTPHGSVPPPAPPPKAEPQKAEPQKAEPQKAEPKAEPKKAEPRKTELKAEPKKAEPKAKKAGDSLSRDPKADPERKEAKKADPENVEPAQADPKAGPRPPFDPRERHRPHRLPMPVTKVRKVRKVHEFKGGKSADELMKGLANLSAVRSLGKMDAEKLKAAGLEGTKKSVTLVVGSSPRVFLIGSNTFGNTDLYLQSKDDGRVYVVRSRLLDDFRYAEFRLVDRALYSFERTEVERVVISAQGKKRTLVQQARRDPNNNYFWTDEAGPQQRNELFRNFMIKSFELRVIDYATPGQKCEGQKLILAIEYFAGGKSLGLLRLFHCGAERGAGDQSGDYYAQTSNTRAMVRLGRNYAEEIARDVMNVLHE